ncbi:MAG: CzcABC family efflux RND transporter, outer membrane protein [Pseudolabrys sp.]|jgi:outer membrane protein TolC|nr:CzcABC family efflux RND transporter, outer membrane protein [Pseudolabrys sp.]
MEFVSQPTIRKLAQPGVRSSGVLLLGALLSGCASFAADRGMTPVAQHAESVLQKDVTVIRNDDDAAVAQAAVRRLSRKTLTVEAAVQIALLNNRGLQATYNELAAAEATMVGDSLPPNPTFSISRIAGAGSSELETQIALDILALATLPVRSEIAAQRFRQAQLRAIDETLRVAFETRRAYYRAVAAQELVALLVQAEQTAKTTAELATKLGETGSLNKLDQAREQVFYAETTADLASARQQANTAREQLTRLLGLWGTDLNFRLPTALPALPARPLSQPTIEADAVSRRVDLQIARIELAALARSYGLTQATRFLNMLEVAGIKKTTREPELGTIRERGVDVQLQIPLFDFGEVRVRQAEANYMQAVNRLTEKAVNVRSEAREAYRTYRASYDIAAHYQREVLPLRKIISDESQLRFSAMQIDVFALLQEARQRIASLRAAIEAKRDFWLAQTNLKAVVVGGGPGGELSSSQPTTTASSAPAAGGH